MTVLYIIGYPKSGGTWLARLLGDVLDSPVGATTPQNDGKCIAHEGKERTGPHQIRQGHSIPIDKSGGPVIPRMGEFAYRNLTDERVVFMLRDPRDVLVSVAHHWGLSQRTALNCMARGLWPVDFGGGYERYVRAWMAARFQYVQTCYEGLLNDTETELRRILGLWELEYDETRLREAVARQSFENRRAWTEKNGDGLPYGKEFQLRFLRRGIAGSWRDELAPNIQREANTIWRSLLVELGYVRVFNG